MKIVCISDLHERLPTNLPEGDVLAIAGDITFKPRNDFNGQYYYLTTIFADWVNEQLENNFKHVIWIAGNHDVVLEHETVPTAGTYLQDSSVTIDGKTFWGSPHSTPFGNWGFNTPAEERDKVFATIPDDCDLVIAHPPARVGELGVCDDGYDAGDGILKEHLIRSNAKHCIGGHIHEGAGQQGEIRTANGGVCKVYNCSIVDLHYRVIDSNPLVIEL